eukprot:10794761-Prorocentrum_lima.AAC.1
MTHPDFAHPEVGNVTSILHQVLGGRAPGPDGLPPEALRLAPAQVALHLHPLLLKCSLGAKD